MFIHNVFFWLKNDLDAQSTAAFEQGLYALTHDSNVKSGHYGKPAGVQRNVVDNSYTYALALVFDDRSGHDQYQVGAVHKEFLDKHASKWERVVVYDVQTL